MPAAPRVAGGLPSAEDAAARRLQHRLRMHRRHLRAPSRRPKAETYGKLADEEEPEAEPIAREVPPRRAGGAAAAPAGAAARAPADVGLGHLVLTTLPMFGIGLAWACQLGKVTAILQAPRHATPRHATPRHATPRHATPRHATPRHATPRHATPRHATPRHATPRHATPRHATPRHATPRHATPRHATPRHATPRHATPRHATPRHATPRHATPRHATPRHARAAPRRAHAQHSALICSPVLGCTEAMLPIAWLAGPISGMVVQPLVGSLSDRTVSRLGRRRYWMWVGSGGVAVSMILMMLAAEIGRLFGDRHGHQPVALSIAVTTFWSADFFINGLQGPARTLLVDVVPPHQQALGNGLFSVWDSLGKILGFHLGSIDAVIYAPMLLDRYDGELFASVRLMFIISVLSLLITLSINQICVVEPPSLVGRKEKQPRCGPAGCLLPLADALKSIPTMPRHVRAVFAALFCLFFAWFTTWMYMPAFMGVEIYGGDPTAQAVTADPASSLNLTSALPPQLPLLPPSSPPPVGLSNATAGYPSSPPLPTPAHTAAAALRLYNDGVRANSLGMTLASVLTLLLAPLLPLVARLGEGLTWLLLELVHAVVLMLAAFTTLPSVAVGCVALFGAPFAAFLVIPYSIVGRAAAEGDSRGVYMATMNLFLCLPELLVSLVLGPVVSMAGGSLRVPLFIAAAATLVGAAIIAWFLILTPASKLGALPTESARSSAAKPRGSHDGSPPEERERVMCRPALGSADCQAESYVEWSYTASAPVADCSHHGDSSTAHAPA
ncbi:hypothetical protein AB1Y20_006084 [Prymnesium parvum]|uniref:Uncharacterized protein n=1 Tax=Prymnesium parvum TaxID=97485 RepID=A0AB34J288_PRYPA